MTVGAYTFETMTDTYVYNIRTYRDGLSNLRGPNENEITKLVSYYRMYVNEQLLDMPMSGYRVSYFWEELEYIGKNAKQTNEKIAELPSKSTAATEVAKAQNIIDQLVDDLACASSRLYVFVTLHPNHNIGVADNNIDLKDYKTMFIKKMRRIIECAEGLLTTNSEKQITDYEKEIQSKKKTELVFMAVNTILESHLKQLRTVKIIFYYDMRFVRIY